MAKVGVFFSYEYDRDHELYGSFFAQAKKESDHTICDYSLDKVHPPAAKIGRWKLKNGLISATS